MLVFDFSVIVFKETFIKPYIKPLAYKYLYLSVAKVLYITYSIGVTIISNYHNVYITVVGRKTMGRKRLDCRVCGAVLGSPDFIRRRGYICKSCHDKHESEMQRNRYRANKKLIPKIIAEGHNCKECGVVLSEGNWHQSKTADRVYMCKSCAITRWRTFEAGDSRRAQVRATRMNAKIEVLTYYSQSTPPMCINPFGEHGEPYITIDALTIDHINGGGTRHRKSVYHMYEWLKKNSFPSGYQVLCANCQTIKELRRRRTQAFGLS